ncbi:MAG: PAS domain S-box protein, partial [Desulfobacterales bacterium]|nr:PAS domain S-box protein [Desulfobacterales bacterium]
MEHDMDREQIEIYFTNSPIGTYVVQNKKFCFANKKFQEIFGYTEKQLFTKSPIDLVVEEDKASLRKNAIDMLKSRRTKPYEFKINTRTGQTRWIVESVASMIYEGHPAVMGHFMDVTETRQIEKALKISEQKYRSIFELAREGILITDYKDGRILDANMEFQRQTGYPINRLKNKKVWELQPPEFQKEARQSFFRFKENRGGLISWKLCQNQNGKMLPVEILAQHMVMENRDVIICMVRDTSEREAMIRALTLASEEWRKSFDALDDAVMLISPDFRIQRANMATSRLLNTDITQLIGMQCHRLVHGADHPPEHCPHLKAQKTGIYCETEQSEPHLGRILHFCASPIKDDKGCITHTVEVISDRTKHRQNEKKSLRLSQDLADSFNGITEALSGLVESRDPYTAGHSKHVAKLALETGKVMGLNKEDLEGLRVCALLHDIGKATIPAGILSKPGKLSQHEWGFIQEHPTTAYETLRRIPFPWPVADVVHQHHERLDGSGYPLGLKSDQIHPWARIIAVADIFDAMTSHRPYRPGLPLREAVEELSSGLDVKFDPQAVAAINHVMTLENKQVMVVDSDPEVIEGLCRVLEQNGFEPKGFTTPDSALLALKDHRFPVVVTELEMAETDGVVLTRKIKEIYPDTQVIMTALVSSKEGTLSALRAGASDFIEKPIQENLFEKTIRSA